MVALREQVALNALVTVLPRVVKDVVLVVMNAVVPVVLTVLDNALELVLLDAPVAVVQCVQMAALDALELVRMIALLHALVSVLDALDAQAVVHLVRVTVRMGAPIDAKVTAVKHVVVDAQISVLVVMLDALAVVVLAPVNVIKRAPPLAENLVNQHALKHV